MAEQLNSSALSGGGTGLEPNFGGRPWRIGGRPRPSPQVGTQTTAAAVRGSRAEFLAHDYTIIGYKLLLLKGHTGHEVQWTYK